MEATEEDPSRLGAVLVTGGCGYFGSNLVKILLRDPECSSISVVCRNPNENQEEGAYYYEGDITNESNVKTLLFKIQPRVIFHLASPRPEAGKADQNRTNVLGTQILLACAAKIPSIRALVYTSCAAAVELSPTNSRLTEEQSKLYTAKSRASPYEKSKAIADALVLAANSPGLRTVTLRLPPIYGEGDPVLTPNIMTMMRQGKHTIQIGKNQKVFDYVYIDNAIHGHILAAKALLQVSEEKVDGEAFFVTDDSPLPFYSFARKIWHAAGDRTEDEDIRVVSRGLVLATALINEWFYFVFSLGFKKPEVTFYDVRELEKGMCFSIEKARRRLGYNPVVLLDDGIKLAVDRGLERQDLRVVALRGRPEPDW